MLFMLLKETSGYHGDRCLVSLIILHSFMLLGTSIADIGELPAEVVASETEVLESKF